MRLWFRRLALALAVLALCMPIGLMVVYLLFPLWRWLEATFGIEAVAHGGPAAWCYAVVYLTLVAAAFIMMWVAKRQPQSPPIP